MMISETIDQLDFSYEISQWELNTARSYTSQWYAAWVRDSAEGWVESAIDEDKEDIIVSQHTIAKLTTQVKLAVLAARPQWGPWQAL